MQSKPKKSTQTTKWKHVEENEDLDNRLDKLRGKRLKNQVGSITLAFSLLLITLASVNQ
jgi:hypothetical protein